MDNKELISKLKEITKELEERQVQSQESTVHKTYKIGEYFKIKDKYYLLSHVGSDKVAFVCLSSGRLWDTPTVVTDDLNIIKEEMSVIIECDSVYWVRVSKQEALQAVLDRSAKY